MRESDAMPARTPKLPFVASAGGACHNTQYSLVRECAAFPLD